MWAWQVRDEPALFEDFDARFEEFSRVAGQGGEVEPPAWRLGEHAMHPAEESHDAWVEANPETIIFGDRSRGVAVTVNEQAHPERQACCVTDTSQRTA
jgi:hypothetical protein